MFGQWLKGIGEALRQTADASELERVVRAELRGADEESVLVVSAIVGLLGTIAYADREYSETEEAKVLEELHRIAGLSQEGAASIARVLKQHMLEAATVQAPRYARTLLELADRELRCQVLSVLVGIAAADEQITTAETNSLRQLTTALGLTQTDYNELQAEHRTRLSVLKNG